jgi:hypothetical protein
LLGSKPEPTLIPYLAPGHSIMNPPKPRESGQTESFAPVENPAFRTRAGYGRLVAHTQNPRFVASVDLTKGSLRLVEALDDINAWSREHASPGEHPQAALFKLFSAAIEWVRANKDRLPLPGETAWPPLPKDGFFSGRSATREDVESGTAYFQVENGVPIDITLPQYAYAFDVETNEPFPCIILQAEQEPRGDKVTAYLDLRTNEARLANFDGFVLLGTTPPEIQPARLATPRYETLHKAAKNLSGLVSSESGVLGKRDCVRTHKDVIGSLLGDGLANCSPLEFFTLLDAMKSLVSRDLLLRRRARSMGLPEPDIMFHAIDVDQTCSLLEDDPETAVFSIYQSPDEEFYGFLVFVQSGQIHAERFPIATGTDGRATATQLRELISQRMWSVPNETERVLFPLLELFGSSVIPRLERLNGPRKLIIVPHRWTHILPLHMMTMPQRESVVTLDDVVTATTFASSLTSFEWSFKSSLAAVRPEEAKLALVCVDVDNLGAGAEFELVAYKNMFADTKGVDIVTTRSAIPVDLSVYPVLVWSSHGVSDPTTWENNRLIFESEVFSAQRISESWDLRTGFVAILAACETGIDLSTDQMLDEYYGLDMAFQIAGCATVVSTMWRVEENVAGYTAVQLLEGLFLNEPPSSHLRVIRHLYRTGNWYKMAEMAHRLTIQDTALSHERRTRRIKVLDHLLSLPKDAFAHPSRWGVFRSYGRW